MEATTTDKTPDDGLVHVQPLKGWNVRPPALCGKTGQTCISSARGPFGPGGANWAQVCRACHQIEFKLKEPLA